MKKALRIILPIILAIAILLFTAWYLFVYDREFTRDVLLSAARYSENQGKHNVAAWFYRVAYAQSGNNDDVAIELAEQYKSSGNYTKAEYTLSNAIADGGGVELYIALCNTYVEQDKLLDAVTMLDSVSNPDIKDKLAEMRPAAPTTTPTPGFYSQYISAELSADNAKIYVSASGEYPSVDTAQYSGPIALSDGENTIYALSIAENGLVSPLSVFGYTIGGVVEKINFNDSAIETSVRTILNTSEASQLFTNDLWTIKSYEVPAAATSYSDIKHMTFLEQLTIHKGKAKDFSFLSSLANLTELIISDTDISQDVLKSIASLPMLKKLTLSNCNLSGISPLSKASGLIHLDINNNTVRNIDALSELKNLQELYMQHNAVNDLTPISGLTQLTKLDVSSNALTTLTPVSSLTALTWLNASVNSITELGQIGNLTKLTNLNIGSNQLNNVNGITSCTALVDLNISSNALTDISGLAKLTNMMYFDFSYNQIETIPAFPKDCQLVTITGSNNLISSLENLSGLLHLNFVHMDYNTSISSVKPLADCPLLIEVNVYATKVKDVKILTDQSIIVNYKPV